MINTIQPVAKTFLALALLMLLLGLGLGVTAAHSYLYPDLWKNSAVGFSALRPMHVSSVLFWIILGATGCVYSGLWHKYGHLLSARLAVVQLTLWIIAIVWIFYNYLHSNFGGREYWEFNPWPALPIAVAWLLFIINFIKVAKTIRQWPVYLWMWMTGLVFFLFTFIENYLWLFPYFREHFVTDMTIQWKANGSLVGSWNQLLYGTAIFLMEKISGDKKTAYSKLSFAMYFLGLFNLMFNWGHHVYTLPTDAYVRYVGYAVSMTEWIFFARIIYTWKQSVSNMQKHYHYFPYRFLMASELWVFINMGQAIIMSIPAFNLYTHGTHVTVAHAMGTTIGINSMILLAACFEFLDTRCYPAQANKKWLNISFWGTQVALLIFWFSLNAAGIEKGLWQMGNTNTSFSTMMSGLSNWFLLFVYSGIVLMITLGILAVVLLRNYVACNIKQRKQVTDKKEKTSTEIKFA